MVGNKAVQPAGVAAYHAVRLGEGERGFKAAVAEPKPAAAVFHVKCFVGRMLVCADELRRVFYGHVLALNAVFNRGNHVVPLFQPCVYHVVIALLRRAGGEHIERHCARYYGGGSGAGIEYHGVAAVFALYEANLGIEAFKPAAVEHYVAPVVYARVPAKSVAAAAQGIHVLLGGWYNGRGHRRVLRRAAKPLPAFAYAAANDGKTPEMPFPEAGAMSQGYIGYQLSQAILNDLKARGIDRSVANVITQTVVNPEDPAFQNPTKPVGAFMTEEEAKAKAAETGWTFKEDAGRGWRQVVASPKPERIVEFDAVKDLVDNGYIVVSTGGGGVPVFETDKGYEGVPAVIDKDRSSAKLAADFGADMLVILTAVEKVCINFNKPDQEELSTMTVAEAREYIAQGQFAPGSMLPKVEACIEYVEAFPKGKALITSLECAAAGLEGKTGTVIVA